MPENSDEPLNISETTPETLSKTTAPQKKASVSRSKIQPKPFSPAHLVKVTTAWSIFGIGAVTMGMTLTNYPVMDKLQHYIHELTHDAPLYISEAAEEIESPKPKPNVREILASLGEDYSPNLLIRLTEKTKEIPKNSPSLDGNQTKSTKDNNVISPPSVSLSQTEKALKQEEKPELKPELKTEKEPKKEAKENIKKEGLKKVAPVKPDKLTIEARRKEIEQTIITSSPAHISETLAIAIENPPLSQQISPTASPPAENQPSKSLFPPQQQAVDTIKKVEETLKGETPKVIDPALPDNNPLAAEKPLPPPPKIVNTVPTENSVHQQIKPSPQPTPPPAEAEIAQVQTTETQSKIIPTTETTSQSQRQDLESILLGFDWVHRYIHMENKLGKCLDLSESIYGCKLNVSSWVPDQKYAVALFDKSKGHLFVGLQIDSIAFTNGDLLRKSFDEIYNKISSLNGQQLLPSQESLISNEENIISALAANQRHERHWKLAPLEIPVSIYSSIQSIDNETAYHQTLLVKPRTN